MGGFHGETNAGLEDLFLTKWSPSGSNIWTRIWGGAGGDYGRGPCVDSADNVYVSGSTDGSFDGEVNTGGDDDFIGFVFGYQGLGAGEGYYMLSWKQGTQSGRTAGMRLLRVNDIPTSATSTGTGNELWAGADSARISPVRTTSSIAMRPR